MNVKFSLERIRFYVMKCIPRRMKCNTNTETSSATHALNVKLILFLESNKFTIKSN